MTLPRFVSRCTNVRRSHDGRRARHLQSHARGDSRAHGLPPDRRDLRNPQRTHLPVLRVHLQAPTRRATPPSGLQLHRPAESMMSSSVATGVLSALTGPQRLKLKLAREHPLDFNRSFGSLIFVAGTGRSGTTGLAGVLNAGRGRIIFEPLRVRWGAVGDRELPRYIAPDTNDADLEQLVRSILLARFKSNEWTGRGNTRVVSRRRIIKDVHSNLRLGW